MSSTSTPGPLIHKYYETLFDAGEEICVGLDAKGRTVQSIASVLAMDNYTDLQYICVNPLVERRLDENVTAYRNFLFENDSGLTKVEQAQLIKNSGLPYSALVWSGNKSIHIIVSMESALSSRAEYDFVWLWIYNILCSKVPPEKCYDNKTKNPSRFSRVPGGTNVKYDDLGQEKHRQTQSLIQVKGRVLDDTMNAWLMAHLEHKPAIKKYDPSLKLSDSAKPEWLTPWTQYLLDTGVFKGKRNEEFHRMAYDFYECGFSLEEAVTYVQTNAKNLDDFPRREIDSTFASGYKICERRTQ